MNGLTLLLACGAVYRLTLLVTSDLITKPLRERIIGRYVHPRHECPDGVQETPNAGWRYLAYCRCHIEFVGNVWGEVAGDMNEHLRQHRGEVTRGPRWLILLDCPWCASVWISAPVAWSAWCFADRAWWVVPAAAFTMAAFTGIAATFASPES